MGRDYKDLAFWNSEVEKVSVVTWLFPSLIMVVSKEVPEDGAQNRRS